MIRSEILASAESIRDRFRAAQPFRHIVVDDFLEFAAAEALLADFPPFDERSALNEHGEVGRKAVHERVTSFSTFYREFYRYINSRPFLDAMSGLTGIPDLIADETLFGGGTHENLDGQALDVHVDFNIDERRMLHRRVNLLIYLNKEWDARWGGAIELHSNPWDPAANVRTSIVPLFNRAVLFETNEYSWHGFPRIALPSDRKHLSRKSFSIYLYTRDRPVDEVVAPHTTFYVPQALPANITAGAVLSQADVDELRSAVAHRDGLLRMYQKLLVEKEQRLRDFMRIKQEALARGDQSTDVILSPRTWRIVMTLHRLRHRLHALRRTLRMARR